MAEPGTYWASISSSVFPVEIEEKFRGIVYYTSPDKRFWFQFRLGESLFRTREEAYEHSIREWEASYKEAELQMFEAGQVISKLYWELHTDTTQDHPDYGFELPEGRSPKHYG